jgi:pyruvate dehydrogenase E1 component
VYELAVIVQDGLKRMYHDQEQLFYYITLYNETYPQPPMPPNAEEGIREGMYKFRAAPEKTKLRAQLLGSGPLMNDALRAQTILAERYGVSADVWSVTSYKNLRFKTLEAERWNMLHPEEPPRESYLQKAVRGQEGPFVAVSDYVRLVPEQIAPWIPGGLLALGTDGFGRSETRKALRDFFEVDAEHIVVATLYALHRRGEVDARTVSQAVRDLGVKTDGEAPWLR